MRPPAKPWGALTLTKHKVAISEAKRKDREINKPGDLPLGGGAFSLEKILIFLQNKKGVLRKKEKLSWLKTNT